MPRGPLKWILDPYNGFCRGKRVIVYQRALTVGGGHKLPIVLLPQHIKHITSLCGRYACPTQQLLFLKQRTDERVVRAILFDRCPVGICGGECCPSFRKLAQQPLALITKRMRTRRCDLGAPLLIM